MVRASLDNVRGRCQAITDPCRDATTTVPDMGSPKGLRPDEAARVKAALERLLRECGTQTELARRLGVTKQGVQRVLSGDGRAGIALARRVADALGISIESLLSGAVVETAMEVRLSSLAGWTEAEQEARRRYYYLPDTAWRAVRNLRTDAPPRRLTPEWIGQIAAAWAQGMEPVEPSQPPPKAPSSRNGTPADNPGGRITRPSSPPNSLYR